MRIIKGLRRSPEIAGLLARDPGQVRYLGQWRRELHRAPIEANLPWLPFRVIDLLEKHLTTDSKVFEFGGGGSTLWFAKRAGTVVTVEHHPEWYPVLANAVAAKPGVTVLHETEEDNYSAYVRSIAEYPDAHFDVVVVDGRQRVQCLEEALPKVKSGGLLLLDDSQRERYRPAFDLAAGWPVKTYRGLTPSKSEAGVTTVWRKP